MYVISLTVEKGGVAKTTTAVNLAYWLAGKGKRVLFVDSDPQGNATTALHCTPETSNSLTTLLNTGFVTPAKTRIPGFDVIASTWDLIAQKTEKGSAVRLSNCLKQFDRKYDYCIIDSPHGHSELGFNVYQASDGIIAPIIADAINLTALVQTLDTLKIFSKSNPDLTILGIVLTMYEPRYLITREVTDVIQREMDKRGIPILGTVRRSVRALEANTAHRSIFEHAPNSPVANDYNAIFENVYRRINNGN